MGRPVNGSVPWLMRCRVTWFELRKKKKKIANFSNRNQQWPLTKLWPTKLKFNSKKIILWRRINHVNKDTSRPIYHVFRWQQDGICHQIERDRIHKLFGHAVSLFNARGQSERRVGLAWRVLGALHGHSRAAQVHVKTSDRVAGGRQLHRPGRGIQFFDSTRYLRAVRRLWHVICVVARGVTSRSAGEQVVQGRAEQMRALRECLSSRAVLLQRLVEGRAQRGWIVPWIRGPDPHLLQRQTARIERYGKTILIRAEY